MKSRNKGWWNILTSIKELFEGFSDECRADSEGRKCRGWCPGQNGSFFDGGEGTWNHVTYQIDIYHRFRVTYSSERHMDNWCSNVWLGRNSSIYVEKFTRGVGETMLGLWCWLRKPCWQDFGGLKWNWCQFRWFVNVKGAKDTGISRIVQLQLWGRSKQPVYSINGDGYCGTFPHSPGLEEILVGGFWLFLKVCKGQALGYNHIRIGAGVLMKKHSANLGYPGSWWLIMCESSRDGRWQLGVKKWRLYILSPRLPIYKIMDRSRSQPYYCTSLKNQAMWSCKGLSEKNTKCFVGLTD